MSFKSFTLKKQLLVLAFFGILVYLPSLGNKFVWDDEQFIYKNSFVQAFDVKKIFTTSTTAGAGNISNYYRPLTTLSFAWDHQWWGFNPIGFHLTNTLLHTTTGLLLLLLLRSLKLNKHLSFWVSVFFLIHPLQTEAVVYANSRGDSLYSFFTMLALLLFSYSWQNKIFSFKIYDKKFIFSRGFLLFSTVISYTFAIFSKEIGIAEVALLFLVGLHLFLQNLQKNKLKISENIKKSFPQLTALFASVVVAASYLWLRATSLNFINSFNLLNDGGASEYSSSLLVRLLTFNRIVWRYFGLLVFPYPLHMERDSEVITSLATPWSFFSLGFAVLVILIGILEFKKQKTWWWLFGWAWFFLMLTPVSGIVPINGLMYEHWLYLPMIGFYIAIGSLLLLLFKKFLKTKYIYWLLSGGCSILILLTLRQNYIWGDPIRFYEHTLTYTQSARLFNNLGMAYAEDNQNEKAIESYQKTLEITKNYPQTFHNIGNIYLKLNQLDKAEESFIKALEINPEFFYSYQPLINIYVYQKNNQKMLELLNHIEIHSGPLDPQLVNLKKQIEIELSTKSS